MKTTVKAGMAALMLFAISCTKESANKISSSVIEAATMQPLSFHIGQSYGGGIIFYIDSTGKHGLIADTRDLGDREWGDGPFVGATSVGIGTGKANTLKIISVQGTAIGYAARECANSTRNGHTDWFLPSKNELNALYKHQNVVGGFTGYAYWSSSENNYNYAWIQFFDDGYQLHYAKFLANHVRAIRAF